MNVNLTDASPSAEAQRMLEVLQDAVTQSLERKKRLGQYAVVWEQGRPVLIGEDAGKIDCR